MKKDQFSGVPEEAELLDEVEAALFRRATGYEDSSGKPVPPDVRAAMYWLENRCPERWNKKRLTEKETDGSGGLTEEENQL